MDPFRRSLNFLMVRMLEHWQPLVKFDKLIGLEDY
jgi:hypothetical protein